MTIEASLVGDWAETYPKPGHLALILPLAFEGSGSLHALRLRVEGISKPLDWIGCWHNGALYPRPSALAVPVSVSCVFQGQGQHAPVYMVAIEGKSVWTWDVLGEFQLRPGVTRYVVRPGKAKQRT